MSICKHERRMRLTGNYSWECPACRPMMRNYAEQEKPMNDTTTPAAGFGEPWTVTHITQCAGDVYYYLEKHGSIAANFYCDQAACEEHARILNALAGLEHPEQFIAEVRATLAGILSAIKRRRK